MRSITGDGPHTGAMLNSVLIANRGAIAVRIIRTLKKMGVRAIAVYAEADANAPHASLADEAWSLGEGRAADTYLNQEKIFAIIKKCGAQAVHPGYGFLSENADFCSALEAMGVAFIGPTALQMQAFGLKHEARKLAQHNSVPLLPGTGLLESVEQAVVEAEAIGFPVILKSTAGGGGIGMQICHTSAQLQQCWQSIKRLSANNFSNSGVFLEKYIEFARHIEVQIFGDGKGCIAVLGDRDCSSQRRHQKVIEEAPAPNIPQATRNQLHDVAKQLMQAVNYRNAGTVEFIYDQKTNGFYFLEVNTRLQVEHGVTELIYSVDLVQWMVQCAAQTLPDLNKLQRELVPQGHAIQARIYAENPSKDFQPSTGVLTCVRWPETNASVRIDHWVASGTEITPYYDPMLAKVMVHFPTRAEAIVELEHTLAASILQGVETNKGYVQAILQSDTFINVEMYTRFLSGFGYQPKTVEVLNPGTMTTLQDYPGRVGYWHVGVPPSGPFDAYSFRLGNLLLGNDSGAAGLEITMNGPTLLFHAEQTIVVTGASIEANIDGELLPLNQPITVKAQQILKLGKITGAGARAYCLFKGGLQCENYLGAKATFTLGQFGGLTGQALRTGNFLPITGDTGGSAPVSSLPKYPIIEHHWQLHVIYGPHGAPDFFTEDDIQTFFKARWKVHYNSSRTGVRLIGPKPLWARTDGGEAGLHPSNIHDNAYAIGAVDFTGDMPVILGPDGPSLGGFVCPVTVITADLWKLGQLAPGDTIEFIPVSVEQAAHAWRRQNAALTGQNVTAPKLTPVELTNPIIKIIKPNEPQAQVIYRLQGDQNLLVEYGPLQLDIRTRFRAHALMLWLHKMQQQSAWQNILLDITPGVRSVQIHYNSLLCSLDQLVALLSEAEQELDQLQNFKVPSRIVHLPISWNDEQCQLAINKYMQSVRKDAPWCPDNIEFIRRINGLNSVDQVKEIVLNAHYVVLGLGDVYLGAPVATPLDPRHRLVTTKYNPARTWTAENSVGIGGSYLCVYGMEGPGGYQFVGRTLQMWNRYKVTHEFNQPWLLRFFDQIRFYEVSAEELKTIRKQFPQGRYPLKIENTEFSLAEYEQFLTQNTNSIKEFTQHRNRAFQQELDHWVANGQFHFDSDVNPVLPEDENTLEPGCVGIESPVSGSVWQMNIEVGGAVKEGDVVCVLESMKMEIDVYATATGRVQKIVRGEGQQVSAGQPLIVVNQIAE